MLSAQPDQANVVDHDLAGGVEDARFRPRERRATEPLGVVVIVRMGDHYRRGMQALGKVLADPHTAGERIHQDAGAAR